jgi:hypothetical protein
MLIRMNTLRFLTAALVLLFCCSLPAAAQDKGPWRASSSEAKAITGDISIEDARLIINFSGFTIAQIRALTAAEASAAFDADPSTPGGGNLYRLSIPADKRFQHKNTLCGSDETQWMATWASGSGIRVAFFSGPNIPILTLEALNSSNNVCGNYSYIR